MELERKIQELQNKRRILRTRMNASHDPFNFKFPPEIASLIFSLSMRKGDYEPNFPTLRKLPTPFLLGSVSQRWRQLARSTPQLWSTISFTLVKEETKALPPLRFINDWLQLSGSLPLTLWITGEAKTDFPSETCYPVIDSLNRHSGRWHKLSLLLDAPYFGYFGTSSPSNLYDLEVIHGGPTDISETPIPHLSMRSRPSPTRLTIYDYRLSAIDIAWRNIKYLMLECITSHECMEAIKLAPLLESCTMLEMYTLSNSDPSWSFHSQNIFRHTRLRKLITSIAYGSSHYPFIDIMELPSLEELQLELDSDIDVGRLISFLNRSGNRLQRLTLFMNDNLKDLEKLLYRIPSLQKLTCELACHNSAFDMRGLFQNLSSSRPGFLPRLDSLELRSFSGFVGIDDNDLAKILALVDQGLNVQILDDGKNYLQKIRQGK
jgi:hypothetical protein